MKKFRRVIENFICDRCGAHVEGNGYRNHCPSCLTSKHVDIFPGDRLAQCHGLMDVTDIALEHGDLFIMHECRRCTHRKRNQIAPDDEVDAVIEFMQQKGME